MHGASWAWYIWRPALSGLHNHSALDTLETHPSQEELGSFKDEVQAIAQLVLEAKGSAKVKGWLLSGDEKNLYAVAYMQLDQDGKMTFSSAKL